ncbi:ribose ABC transporter permease [Streptomyces sulfonofaciens]|uniref:Ribose ABC transporter permease n=1 Tax=Streptomyces sulfonofaciens TaxID=68272 RepID=A0A919L0W6_9ACTN|nr:ribose ABC transporter permease [Streptomyces sulfonofaciens]
MHDDAPPVERVRRTQSRGSELLYRYTVVIVLVAMTAAFSLLRPSTFFTVGNFTTIANSQAVLLILALALTLPLAVGEFDLSVASGLGFGGILTGYLSGTAHWPLPATIAVVLLIGAVVGLVNGLFVVHVGVNAFIITLGTGTVLTGLTLLVSGGQILSGIPSALGTAMTTTVAGLAVPVWIALALTVLLWYLYEYTPLGRYLTFIGLGPEVARLAGVAVKPLRWGAFVAASVIASGCGILAVGLLGSADPSASGSYLLPAYAGAFLGTTVIKPGRFNAWGTVVALALLVVGVTGLQLLGAASWVEQVFNGAALVLAVTFARLVSRADRV